MPFQHSKIDGIEIRCQRAGKGRTVLIMHGWGANLEAVAPIIGALEARAEVLALDMPGFGQSSPPPSRWSSTDYARFVKAFLAAQGVSELDLIGHSFGGRVAICLAADPGPVRIGRVILVDAAGLRPRRRPSYYLKVSLAKVGRVIALLGTPGKYLQERLRQTLSSTDYLNTSETMRETFRAVIAEDLEELLGKIKAPTLLIWGSRDEETPLWMARRMEEKIQNSGLVVLDGGHFSYADQPQQFARVVNHFLVEQERND